MSRLSSTMRSQLNDLQRAYAKRQLALLLNHFAAMNTEPSTWVIREIIEWMEREDLLDDADVELLAPVRHMCARANP